MGIVAFVGAHPILVSLGMMIFLGGLGEFLSRGGDILGFPFFVARIGHGEAYLLITVLACFLGGVDPFGGFDRTVAVLPALVILQTIASGLNLMGAHQHLATVPLGPLSDRRHGRPLALAALARQSPQCGPGAPRVEP